ncbi:hypothetical protein DB41_HL00060 [Neochlamydia sp. TUME1]|uniref:hypothetical protein n=1 Tax=Neochlamydia sp. TUME1 TaxID=1478174 RepID=UPI0005824AB5|nr:hypothetical protein [Neochlamydia sp. TUME1]KIC75473.1 hypothetical protein DB41_HL00060 [Neochlamydia sp. TUME1]
MHNSMVSTGFYLQRQDKEGNPKVDLMGEIKTHPLGMRFSRSIYSQAFIINLI